jgi:hypothetical protein
VITPDEASLPAIQVNALRPYASLVMFQCPHGQQQAAFALLWAAIVKATCAVRIGSTAVIESGLAGIEQYLGNSNPSFESIDEANGFIYRTQRPSSWAQPTSEYIDTRYFLALIIRRRSLLALHCESSARDSVLRWLSRNPQTLLRLVPEDILQGAFLKGEAKVLWLRGAHAPRPTRPDSKQLSGRRLQEALNPLDDNTFAMMSARAALPPDANRTAFIGNVGTTPQKGTVWNRPTNNFDEFVRLVSEVMTTIEEISSTGEGVDRPYPILASATNDLSQVSGAYDAVALPLESSPLESEIDPDLVAAAEVLERAVMIIHPRENGADFVMDVGLDGAIGGSILAQATLNAGRVHFNFGFHGSPTNPEMVRAVLDGLGYGDELITVYYDSGHSISGGRIIVPSVRPEPFRNWSFRDFSGYDITLEKPDGARSPQAIHAEIGRDGDRSLFAWVTKNYSEGFLICDDGPGEVSDFLHLAYDCTLSYIHVKAASTRSANRGVAVGAYEVLASQAVKNLAVLTTRTLGQRLHFPFVSEPACWVDGLRVSARDKFLDALEYHGPQDDTRVIVVQPHVNKMLYDRLKTASSTDEVSRNQTRLQLLETLLNAARGAAMAVGGDLITVGAMA